MEKVIIIPARLQSTRLPRKLLLDLGGKPVIQRVYERCSEVTGVSTYIATDSKEIKTLCENFTNNVILTSKDHISGTSRIAEAIKFIKGEFIVNVQGDEPFIDTSLISNIFDSLEKSEEQIVSAMESIKNIWSLKNPADVKVVTDKFNRALYFSRLPIPFSKNVNYTLDLLNAGIEKKYFKHVGIYGYKRDFLLNFTKLEKSFLENEEGLEQLRFLENGYSIKMVNFSGSSIGIDTEEDYKRALKLIKKIN